MNKNITRIGFIFLLLIVARVHAQQPNIIVLYSDDAGFADFGFQPNAKNDIKHLTPNIDRIAKEGVRFTNGYMSGAVCSPSRAGFMTGRYQERFGHENNLPPGFKSGLPLSENFSAKVLKDIGYTTGLIGKWHLGYPAEYHPNKRGFDKFYGCLQGSRPYFPLDKPSAHRVFMDNDKTTKEEGYITDRIGDGACQFINENHKIPFFLFVAFTSPHGPLQPKEKDYEALKNIKDDKRRKYVGLILSLDKNVGKILLKLEELGIAENTIVVFTNDNGGQTYLGADNYPLKGTKGTFYEGGVRVPMVMKWPDKIPSGLVINQPVISLDFLPTFIAASGIEVSLRNPLDGKNLLPLLQGEDWPTQRPFYWRKHGSNGDLAIRLGDWKWIHRREDNAEPELYNLKEDISESNDLSGSNQKKMKELTAMVQKWEKELPSTPLWGKGAL